MLRPQVPVCSGFTIGLLEKGRSLRVLICLLLLSAIMHKADNFEIFKFTNYLTVSSPLLPPSPTHVAVWILKELPFTASMDSLLHSFMFFVLFFFFCGKLDLCRLSIVCFPSEIMHPYYLF